MEFNFDLGIDDSADLVGASRRFSLGDVLAKRARMDPAGDAIRHQEQTIRYDQLDTRVNRLANALVDRGHQPGEATFALLSENRPEYVEVLYAGAKLGCLVAAQNWRLEEAELVHCVETAAPDVVFVSGRHAATIEWLRDGADVAPEFVVFDEDAPAPGTAVPYDDLVAGGSPDPPAVRVHPEQGFVVMYTSGTTGLPKGAVVSHRAELARTNQVILDYGLEKGDSYPSWAPMFHMGGIDWVITTTVLGGTYYPIDGFDAERLVEVLRTPGCPLSWLILFPGMIDRLRDALVEASADQADYRELRSIGALPDLMNTETLTQLTELLDAPAQNTYGATEIGHATSGNKIPVGTEIDDEQLRKVESPYIQIKLVDEDGEAVAPGESGEVAVRGPPLFSGYLDEPSANRTEFVDGWFLTGDVLQRHEDGSYSYLSRRKYMIKTGGENVYPAEIEDVLFTNDAVEDVCVVREPDEKWGEVPRAIVAAADPETVDATELLEFVAGELANYKLPHYIQIVAPGELPRNTTGKIVRETLEDWPVSDQDRVREV